MNMVKSPYASFAVVQAMVARFYKVSENELQGPGRSMSIAGARQVLMYLARKHGPRLSSTQIGELIGGRDHTTILYGIRMIERRMQHDTALAMEVGQLEERIKGWIEAGVAEMDAAHA